MTEKCWFVLRYNHFPPEGPGATIKLGQIIANPSEPYQPIDFSGPTAFPIDMASANSSEEQFHWDNTHGSDGSASLSAQIDGLPVSGTIGAEFKNTTRYWAEFEKLETKLIIPTPGYIKDSMMRPVVKEFLGNHYRPKSVFMITGMKIARGGSHGQENTRTRGGKFQLGVTPTPAVPMSLGPTGALNTANTDTVSSNAKDFVWAFSLRQIHYRRGVVRKSVTRTEGATLEGRDDEYEDSEDESDIEEKPVDPSCYEYEVDGLDPSNFTGEGSELVTISDKHLIANDQLLLMADKL